jgi:hypothetical protein
MCPDPAPDLDPPVFFNDFQDADKKSFFFLCFFSVGDPHVFKPPGPDPDPLVRGADPDPHQMSRIQWFFAYYLL